jgi:hypothetical protein
VADKPKGRGFDAFQDKLVEELRKNLTTGARYGAAHYDDAAYAGSLAEIAQRFDAAYNSTTAADRTGDISLLQDAAGNLLETVSLQKAAQYSGKSDRQIRRLIRDGVLEAVGLKGNRRVSTNNLLELFPPQK